MRWTKVVGPPQEKGDGMRWTKVKPHLKSWEWHEWYAWHPIMTDCGQIVWLEVVERRSCDGGWGAADGGWEYR